MQYMAMAYFKITLLLALAVVAATADKRPTFNRPRTSYQAPPSSDEASSFEDAKYEFEWQVDEDSNEFGHQEERDGDDTKGSYYVQLPDGRRQTVTYYVDGDSGFVAEVKYSGEAKFDDHGSSEERQPPRRTYRPPDSDEK